jgi:hypothetical protein
MAASADLVMPYPAAMERGDRPLAIQEETMALLDVTQGSWGRDDDHPRWCPRRPWKARCPECKGRGTIAYMHGRHGGANCGLCDGARTVSACKEHETYWWYRA